MFFVFSTCPSIITAGRQRTIGRVGAANSRSGVQPVFITALWLAHDSQQLVWTHRELASCGHLHIHCPFRF